MADDESRAAPAAPIRTVGLVLGPLVCGALLAFDAPAGMTGPAWRVAGIALWMAIWWSTEALPVPATALLPVIAFPLLDIAAITEAAAPFAHPLIFLFLGGFLIAAGLQRWNLHRRMALALICRIGAQPARLVAGFMAATAFLSMWVSNTATTMLMLPIALSVIGTMTIGDARANDIRANFARALLLGVAYGASIGGLATLIGTPPNALLAAFAAEAYGIEIGFARWMAIGLPLMLVLGPLTWLILTRVVFPLPREGGRRDQARIAPIAAARRALGPLTGPELRVGLVFGAMVALWLAQPLAATLPGLEALSDSAIAIAGGLALFVLPSGRLGGGRLLAWRDAAALPWGTLILFGGGLSLADAASATGLAAWIGQSLQTLADWPFPLLILAVVTVIVFLTELTSNTATAATFLPLMGALAIAADEPPLALMAPAALAASAAFMLPVATPPNAIVFGSGEIAMADMIRAGLWLNAIAILAIGLLVPPLLGLVFGP